jgi:hypothetical protein
MKFGWSMLTILISIKWLSLSHLRVEHDDIWSVALAYKYDHKFLHPKHVMHTDHMECFHPHVRATHVFQESDEAAISPPSSKFCAKFSTVSISITFPVSAPTEANFSTMCRINSSPQSCSTLLRSCSIHNGQGLIRWLQEQCERVQNRVLILDPIVTCLQKFLIFQWSIKTIFPLPSKHINGSRKRN